MKKMFLLLVVVLLVAGCNKQKTLQKELTGTWQAYKYIFHNADETQQFTNQYGIYTITFSGGRFARTTTSPDTTLVGGSYYFADNNEQLILVDTTYNYNQIDSIYVASANKEQYTIFDLTSTSLQLVTDSSDLYLEKKQ